MKLWRIYQAVNDGYDTYDSAIVAAETEEAARLVHPSGDFTWGMFRSGRKSDRNPSKMQWGREHPTQDWVYTDAHDWAPPESVGVLLIGEALDTVPAGVVLASFNAG